MLRIGLEPRRSDGFKLSSTPIRSRNQFSVFPSTKQTGGNRDNTRPGHRSRSTPPKCQVGSTSARRFHFRASSAASLTKVATPRPDGTLTYPLSERRKRATGLLVHNKFCNVSDGGRVSSLEKVAKRSQRPNTVADDLGNR